MADSERINILLELTKFIGIVTVLVSIVIVFFGTLYIFYIEISI